MSQLAQSTFLDFQGYGLTNATTVAQAYGFDPSAAETPPPGSTVIVALVLNRANDPTALLNENWATRQQTLATMQANGTLWTTYGANQADYNNLVNTLQTNGITVLGADQGYVSSAASQTIWVQLDAAQFQGVFGTPLKYWPGDSNYDPMLYWDGSLSLPAPFDSQVEGLWISGETLGGTPTPTDTLPGVTLPAGPQSEGNSATQDTNLYPSAISQLYKFPLTGSNAATGTIGLVEPGIGDGAIPSGDNFQTLINTYRSGANITGTGTYYVDNPGAINVALDGGAAGERSLDVGVVAATDPNSTIGLYVGGNNDASNFSAYQDAIWDTTNNPGVISSSYSDGNQSSPGSPFYKAYRELFIDAALRNITLVYAEGDGGSQSQYGNGVPMQYTTNTSPYALAVGGTSIATVGAANTDSTLTALVAAANALDPATLRTLVANGLMTLPTNANAATLLVETVWNQYSYDPTTGHITGYFFNETGAGGVDTTQPTPLYQTEFGLTPTSNSPDPATGRGLPDVSALSAGDMEYLVPKADMTGLSASGGTSAAAPLWASLTAQIQAIFADEGLPTTGFYNDLLYTAAAIAPASFNDVTIGNNISTFVYGGTDVSDGVNITPTGYGYQAGPGYDLTSGLGTPNAAVLTRTLTAIAHAQLYSKAPSVTDSSGATTGVAETLLVQPTLANGGIVAVHASSGGVVLNDTASSPLAWSSQLAGQVLQPNFDPGLVTLFSGAAQAAPTELNVTAGATLAVSIGSNAAAAYQTALTSPFGFASYTDSNGDAVTLARPVAVAQTGLGANDQEAIVRIRQDTTDPLQLGFYRVDDYLGTIDGIAPGAAGYAAAAATRAYQTTNDSSAIQGPGDGQYTTTDLLGVNAGDIIASTLTDGSNTYWDFSAANEVVNNTPVTHLWNYGLNTFGWEATYGGGNDDYSDLVYQLDFTSANTPLACFAAGTRIQTATGPVDVAELCVGDLVPTLIDGTMAPIRWIGHRRVACSRHNRPELVWPVRVSAGAFGPGQPCRDLYLSPDHAVYARGVLIPVKYLINGSTVAQVPHRSVTYFHIELPQHDVVLAEDLPAESYLDTGDRARFANSAGLTSLFPDFSTRVREAAGCAPLAIVGPQVEAICRLLAEHAVHVAPLVSRAGGAQYR